MTEAKIGKFFKLSIKTIGSMKSIHEATGMNYSDQIEHGIELLKKKIEKKEKLIW